MPPFVTCGGRDAGRSSNTTGLKPAASPLQLTSHGTMDAVRHARDNLRNHRSIEQGICLRLMRRVRKSSSPALFPAGTAFLATCWTLLPGAFGSCCCYRAGVGYLLLHHAARTLLRQISGSGNRDFRIQQGSFMHAKVAVIDGQWATVGSSNIDRSACCFRS